VYNYEYNVKECLADYLDSSSSITWPTILDQIMV